MRSTKIRSYCSYLLIGLNVIAPGKRLFADEALQHTPLTFEISSLAADVRKVSSIAVELNNFDVTLFSNINQSTVEINLPTPLANGEHEIRIQAFYENGDIETLLEKAFVIRQNQASGGLAFNLDQSQRFSGGPDSQENSDHHNSQLALSMRGIIEHDAWQLSSEVDAQYDNQQTNNVSGEELDLPLMSLEAQHITEQQLSYVRVGDTLIPQQGLLFNNYQRRGLSAGVSNSQQKFEAQVFAFQSNPTSSANASLFYPTQKKERSVGALASYSPLPNPEAFTISTAYLKGEGSQSGAGLSTLYDEESLYGGDNWSISMDSRLRNKALRLTSEFAWSDFDSDGLGYGEGYRKDTAWKASAEWHAPAKKRRWLFQEWRLGTEVREIGPEFWSLGNLYLPGDVRTEKVYYVGTKGGFSVATELIQERNNVKSQENKSDQFTDFVNIDWYFTPTSLNILNPLWSTLGRPSLSGFAHFSQQRQDDEDALLAGYDLDRDISEYHLSANFDHSDWNWSIQHTQTWMDDHSSRLEQNGFTLYEPASDSVNYLSGLTLGISPAEFLSLNFLIQYSILKEEQTRNKFSNLNFGVDSRYEFIPEKWSINLNYSINENDNRYKDAFNSNSLYRDQTVNLQTSWNALKPKPLSPGVKVFFKGSYLHHEETLTNEQDERYQVLIGCSLYWNKQG